MAGGREMHLRSLQVTALEVANSLFLGDYLTSEGQDAKSDLAMIADAGFVVLGQENQYSAPSPSSTCCSSDQMNCTSQYGEPSLRRRGAGTQQQPNA